MSELPPLRTSEAPPFTYIGVDMFGPFLIKNKRNETNRYGVMFTCLSVRAVHLEITHSMDTDSFIQALKRLIARRGNIRVIYSDNGSNFVGAEKELQKAYNEVDHKKIEEYLQNQGTDWVKWNKNPPAASHMGGVWERQIRSARTILAFLMKTHGHCLDDESLLTVMTETEAIINSRPLTVESLSNPTSMMPLSPSNLLIMKSKVILPPPGKFSRPDMYCRLRWRRVQHIANEFWD